MTHYMIVAGDMHDMLSPFWYVGNWYAGAWACLCVLIPSVSVSFYSLVSISPDCLLSCQHLISCFTCCGNESPYKSPFQQVGFYSHPLFLKFPQVLLSNRAGGELAALTARVLTHSFSLCFALSGNAERRACLFQ